MRGIAELGLSGRRLEVGLVGERDLVGVRDMVERWGGTRGVHREGRELCCA